MRGWGLITPEIVEKRFKKTGISGALDSSEDDLLWKEREENEDPDCRTMMAVKIVIRMACDSNNNRCHIIFPFLKYFCEA